MTKNKFFVYTFSLLSAGLLFYCTKNNGENQEAIIDDFFPRIKSAIGSKENPTAREDYWTRLQLDPATGAVPDGIRQREIAFAKTLPQKSNNPKLRTNATDWTSIGPYNIGGRTRAIAIDIENESTIIAGGVSGGIWKTVDDGNNWIKKTAPQSLHSVTTLAQDVRPGKTNNWYFGTGELQGNSARAPFAPFRGDGIFKSVDNGESWFQLPSTGTGTASLFNSQFQYVWKVITNKFEPNNDEVFAAIVGGIAKSNDGGNSWQIVLGEEFATSETLDLNDVIAPRYSDIVQTENGVFYAVLSSRSYSGTYPKSGIYRSSNGVIWVEITPPGWPARFSRVVMATSTSNPSVLYFLGDDDDNDFLWKFNNTSGDNGVWEDLSANIPSFGGNLGDYDDQGSYNMVIKIHPSDDEVVYLGGTNLYRSGNGFASNENTSWIGGYDSANNFLVFPNHYVDQHDLFFYESNPDKMLSVNDGGIFISESSRSENINWKPLNNGFVTGQSFVLGFDPSTWFGSVIIGFQDNGTHVARNPDFNTRWTRFLGGDGSFCTVAKGEKYIYSSFQNGETYRFTTNNAFKKTSFARVDPIGAGEMENQGYLFVNPFVLDPNNNNIMYMAGGDAIWRNVNLTQIPSGSQEKTSINWGKLSQTILPESQVSAIAITTDPANIVYYGSSYGELFRIDDALNINPQVTEITGTNFPENGYVTSLSVDPNNGNNLLVAFSNYHVQSIFYSDNAGLDFINVSGNLEEFPDGTGDGPSVRWVDIAPARNGGHIYFAATSTGLYSTETLDGENTIWTQEGANTIGNLVCVMVKHRPADGTVFVATHGNGAYQAIFENIDTPNKPLPEGTVTIDPPYPNPFTEQVRIPFHLSDDGNAQVTLYNLQGKKVKELLEAYLYQGDNYVTWDGTNEAGVPVAAGTYILTLNIQGKTLSTKLIYKSS